MESKPTERVRSRIECLGSRGETVTVLELQYYHIEQTGSGTRHYRGARRFQIDGGAPVRLIDARTFEVPDTGELLHHSGVNPGFS